LRPCARFEARGGSGEAGLGVFRFHDGNVGEVVHGRDGGGP
jgi:hypothetical protein